MACNLRTFIKCGFVGMIASLHAEAMEMPSSRKSAEKEKAIHDYWVMKQVTDREFLGSFPKELIDKITQTEFEMRNPYCPIFETPEDLKEFDEALENLTPFNDAKVFIILNEKKYFLDKRENLVILIENNIKKARKNATFYVALQNVRLVDSQVMQSPRRVQCFYNIELKNINRYASVDDIVLSFKKFKMTRLLD